MDGFVAIQLALQMLNRYTIGITNPLLNIADCKSAPTTPNFEHIRRSRVKSANCKLALAVHILKSKLNKALPLCKALLFIPRVIYQIVSKIEKQKLQ